MSGSGSTLAKPVPAPSKREKAKRAKRLILMICFKTQFSNFKSGWISSENMFVAPTRKD